MTHASLFSGIGGPEVAAEMLGWTNLFHCEINPFGRAVLAYHFPESVSYEDITKTDFSQWRGRVDVLTGGFPCQPFSYAGKRGGADDDRYLWPQMCRAIQECQPTWVVGENVAGLATMVEQCEITELGAQPTLFEAVEAVPESLYEERGRYTIDRICQDLEAIGYAVQPVLIPACGVGAPHRRDRIFIVGYAQNAMRSGQLVGLDGEQGSERNERNAGAGDSERICGGTQRIDTPDTSDAGVESVRRERKDAVHRIETPSDTADFGQGRAANPGAESELSQKIRGQRCRAELYLSAQAASGRWPTTDTASLRGRQVFDNLEPELADGAEPFSESSKRNAPDTEDNGLQHSMRARRGESEPKRDYSVGARWQRFPSVSAVHRGNDGLPFPVDKLSFPFDIGDREPFVFWRTESLKAYGNAIVPQVMYEIFRAIEEINPIV